MPEMVKLGDQEYYFEIRSKYTIIQGYSGTGKSRLLEMLRLRRAKLKSKYQFVQLPERTAKESWDGILGSRVGTDAVFYMDEDFPELYTAELQQAMARSNLVFLIACRDPLAHLPYGIQDVYKIEHRSNGKIHDVVPLYNPGQFNPRKGYKQLVTEDSKSGYFFFSSFLKSVDSAGSKGNIFGEWKRRSQTLFVVDGAGFGAEIKKVAELEKERSSNGLLVVESFEEMVLHSGFMGLTIRPSMFENNREKFYERALRAEMQANDLVYSKTKICKCLVADCCKRDGCRLQKRGIKPVLILGRLYEAMAGFGMRTPAERRARILEIAAQQKQERMQRRAARQQEVGSSPKTESRSELEDTNCVWGG